MKWIIYFMFFVGFCPNLLASDEVDQLKKIIAIQQAQQEKMNDSLEDLRIKLDNLERQPGPQGAPGINGKDGKNGQNGVNGKDGKNGQNGARGPTGPNWTNICVISPKWDVCPAGYRKNGNFYACFPNGSTLGSHGTGMSCGGPYSSRHVTLCCR